MERIQLRIEPRPDFGLLERVLRRQGTPDRVPFFDLWSHSEIVPDVLRAIGKEPQPATKDTGDPDYDEWRLRQDISFGWSLGYDYVQVQARNFVFPESEWPVAMTAHGERAYRTAGLHTISNREDFDKYPWPVMSSVDYSPLENIRGLLPQGMKAISGFSGVLENASWLLGYQGLSYLVYDNPQLVKDVFEAVATRIIEYLETVASFDAVGAIAMGDDMGFKTQTFLSPPMLREYVFPWHKKIVDAVHRRSKPILLHSDGNLTEVMEDIIDCGWDAKHSFEDVIEPIWETKKKYGDRIALLGGFDMDKICRMSEEEVREHTRYLIETCAPGGNWALGTGNSVPEYVPIRNFLAMLEEGYGVRGY